MKKESMYIYNSNALATLIKKGDAGRICLFAATVCIVHKTRELNLAAQGSIIDQTSV